MDFFDAGLPASKSSENDFTVTAPSSQTQGLRSSKLIAAFPGSAKNRSLCAPSDQNGVLMIYGITPGATLWSFTEVNRPVSLSLRGNGGKAAPGGAFSSWVMWPAS